MEFFGLAKEFAFTRLDSVTLPLSDTVGSVRVFQDSPETIGFQIRTVGKLTNTQTGKVRRAYSHVSFAADDLDRLIEALRLARSELKKDARREARLAKLRGRK